LFGATPERWTAERVHRRAVKVLSGIPGAKAILATGPDLYQTIEYGFGPSLPRPAIDFVAFAARCLGRTARPHIAMWARARCDVPGRELSWSEYVSQMGEGWTRGKAERWAEAGCQKMARCLNDEGFGWVEIPYLTICN
jgi:hypothetical protein